MKSDRIKFLLSVLFFVVLAVITFRCVFEPDHVFAASDLNIGRLAVMKNSLPDSLTGSFSGNQVMGSSGYNFMLFKVLLAMMPLKLFANTFYGIVLVFGSASMVWFLRLWGRTWFAAIVGALIAFWFNSIMLAAGGHAYKMEVLAFSVLGLCLIEKSIRGETYAKAIGYAVLAGLSIGIMMIEQQDVALLAGLFVGSYAVFRLIQVHVKSLFRWVCLLVPVAVVAILLSGSAVMKSYNANIKGASAVQEEGDGSAKWNYITQWSMVPSEWPDLIAFGWSGWSSNNPEGPYWGKIGQSAEWEPEQKGFRNFKLTSVYFGVIPFMLGMFGLFCAFRNRKSGDAPVVVFWGIAGLLGFLLAFGKYSLLYKLFYELPMMGNVRAPIKFLDNFQICLGIVAAYGVDQLIRADKGSKITKMLWMVGSACTGLLLLAGLKVLVAPGGWETTFREIGFANYTDVMISNMSNAWFHAALLCLVFSGVAFAFWKSGPQFKWVAVVFVMVLAGDSVVQTSRYFKANDIASIEKGNLLIDYLKENQGYERTFLMDQSGIYNQWLASDGPYHGLSLFNIWQMPRMPMEYKEYLSKVGRNQIRLWQLSAIKYVAAPARIQQQLNQNPELAKLFKPVLNYQVPTAQGMRPDVLLEFAGGIPRFALYKHWESAPIAKHCERLVSASHNPLSTVLVDSENRIDENPGDSGFRPVTAEVSRRKAVIKTAADSPSILRFAQRYDARWKVLVDDKSADLLRLDYLSMGVQVPAGDHEVEFLCVKGTSKTVFTILVFITSLCLGIFLILYRNRTVE